MQAPENDPSPNRNTSMIYTYVNDKYSFSSELFWRIITVWHTEVVGKDG